MRRKAGAPTARPMPQGPDSSAGGLGTALGLLTWAAIAITANLLTPLWADDWCRIGFIAMADILARIATEYTTWTGRLGPTLLSYLVFGPLRLPGIPIFEVLNAAVFVALVAGLCWLVQGGAPDGSFVGRLTLTLTAGLLLWWLPSSIAETALWKTGAIAYLWPVAAAVLILGRVSAMLRGTPLRPSQLAVLAVAAAFFATFLEPLSIVVGGMLAVAAAIAWRRREASRTALLLLLSAQGLGTAVLILAPGNFARLDTVPSATPAEWASDWYWFLRSLFDRYAAGLSALVAAVWILAVAVASRAGTLGSWRQAASRLLPAMAPFVAFIAGYLVLLLPVPTAALPSRAGFPVSVALCGIMLVILQDAIHRLEAARPGRSLLPALLALVSLLLVPASGAMTIREKSWTAALQQDFPPLPQQRPTEVRDLEKVLPMPPTATLGRYAATKTRFFLLPGPYEFRWAGNCLADAHGVRAFHVR